MRDQRRTRILAHTLAVAWALWWTLFGVISGIGEGLGAVGVFMHAALPGGICLVIALLALPYTRIGAWLLMGAGAVFAIGYPIMARPQFGWVVVALMLTSLAAPPVVAGVLLLGTLRIKHQTATRDEPPAIQDA